MTLKHNYDVIIIGGGTSGCACGYICAKNNLKVLLVEKNSFLGGLMTGGLVVPVMNSGDSEINCSYYDNLVEHAKKFQAQITYKDKNDGWFNPEVLKIALEDLLTNSKISKNIDILFNSTVAPVLKENKKIKSVVVNSGLLSIPFDTKYVVDATGTAEFSILSGCKLIKDTKEKQANSLRFIVGNVNIKKFTKFIKSIDTNENITNTYRNEIDTYNEIHFTTASTSDETKKWALDRLLKEGVDEGLLLNSDRDYFQIFSVARSYNQVVFNCPQIKNYNDNIFLFSKELIEARKAIWRLYNFVKAKFPGFENSTIINIASMPGVREQNRVWTKYVFTNKDLTSSKHFPDPVLKSTYGIDVHSKKSSKKVTHEKYEYELPVNSLISKDFNNLLVIGKIIGAEFLAHSALRVQKNCMATGEAVAKYIAKKIKK